MAKKNLQEKKSVEWLWDSSLEKSMADFGEAYTGYYMDKDGVRYVGFVNIKPEFRGKGLFHKLMEAVKINMPHVIIISPTEITIHTAKQHDFEYEEERYCLVWDAPFEDRIICVRGKLGGMCCGVCVGRSEEGYQVCPAFNGLR